MKRKRPVKAQARKPLADRKPDDVPMLPPPPHGPALPASVLWPKGVSANPGGAPKGKRMSTWLAEFGQADLTLEQIDAKLKGPGLTLNARMALKQIRRAAYEDDGLPAAAWAADRVEGGVDRTVHLTHKQEPTMSPEEAMKLIKASEAPKLEEF